MKFTMSDASLLWQAINRVMRATPRRMNPSEANAICIETDERGQLFVHRYSSDAYAEHRVPADILEDGKVLVGDGMLAKSIRGRQSFEVVDNNLIATDLTCPDNETRLRLSRTDPFLYTRTPPTVEGMSLTLDLGREVLWLAKDARYLYNWVLLDGDKIVTSNNVNITCMLNETEILDGHAFLPADFFLAWTDKSKLAVFDRKVWVIEDDFKYGNVTMEIPYRSGSYWLVIQQYLDVPKKVLTVSRTEFSHLLQDVLDASEDKVYRSGFCQLALAGNTLTIKSIGSDVSGNVTRVIEAEVVQSGDFCVSNYPRMMMEAINTLEDEAERVTLELCWSETHQAHALILHSEKVYNFIPCSKG